MLFRSELSQKSIYLFPKGSIRNNFACLSTFSIFFLVISMVGFDVFAQEIEQEESHHCLLQENALMVGLGMPYSLDHNQAGINGRFYYAVGEKICFGPEITLFKSGAFEIVDFDFVIHYIIETPILGIYPVLGVNYTKEEELEHQEDAWGIVFGAGIHRNFGKVMLFSEYTRVESQLNDQLFTIGLMYMVKLRKQE